MKRLLLYICLVVFPYSLFSQNWKRVGKKVKHIQKELINSNSLYKDLATADFIYQVYIPLLDKARNMYNIWENLDINANNDTIFILDYPQIGEEYCDSYIWKISQTGIRLHIALAFKPKGDNWELDRKATLSRGTKKYIEEADGISEGDFIIKGYTNICYKELAEKWSIPAIRFGEEYGAHYVQEQSVYLTRIVFKNSKMQCDCISFRNFQCIRNEYM